MSSSLRALKWPLSRNWTIFLGSASTLASLYAYDRFHKQRLLSQLTATAKTLCADLPCSPHDMPRRVVVYIAPGSDYARFTFTEYVKPVFDAAALDYEVVKTADVGQVRDHVRDAIWTGKEEALLRPAFPYPHLLASSNHSNDDSTSTNTPTRPPPPPPPPAAAAAKKRSLLTRILFGSGPPPPPPSLSALPPIAPPFSIDPVARLLMTPKYSAATDIIAIGYEAWTEILSGLDQGLATSRSHLTQLIAAQSALRAHARAVDADLEEDLPFFTKMWWYLTRPGDLRQRCWGMKARKVRLEAVERELESEFAKVVDLKQQQQQQQREEQDLMDHGGQPSSSSNGLSTPATSPLPLFAPLDRKDLTNAFNLFALPSLGFIPGRNLVGWRNFPARIYRWLHQRDALAVIGAQSLTVCLAEKKRGLVDSDAFLGAGEGILGIVYNKDNNKEQDGEQPSTEKKIKTTTTKLKKMDELVLNRELMAHMTLYC